MSTALCVVVFSGCGKATDVNSGLDGRGGEAGASGGATTSGNAGNSAGGPESDAGGALVDLRPEPPEWLPPFSLGSPGWLASTTPNCVKEQGSVDAYSVWADARGVFSLASIACNFLAEVPCGAEGLSLMFNPGTGWRSSYALSAGSPQSSELGLTGFPGGPLLMHGVLADDYGLFLLADGAPRNVWKLHGSTSVFVTGPKRAYALDAETVLEWSGDAFRPIATLTSAANAIWADDEVIVVVGNDQSLLVRPTSGGDFRAVPDVPAGNYTAVWGFAADDLWLGNLPGQLVHYDGKSFQIVDAALANEPDPAIRGLWGSNGQLFFRTTYQFGRVARGAARAERLLQNSGGDVPRIHVTGMWGRSQDELFLTLMDEGYAKYRCGGLFTVVYDGAEFHAF